MRKHVKNLHIFCLMQSILNNTLSSPLPPHPTRPRPRPCNACTRALRSPPCHPELVAGKAPWQAAHCACRLARCACRSSFPKISLRCAFREPCFFRAVERVSENTNRPCHFDLVVTRLCCQHFAIWQNARPARRLLLFPKISLRCDFREPYNKPRSRTGLLR